MISLDLLGKMMRSLSAEQLAKLPVEKLPEQVPELVFTIGTPEKNAVLEDLLMRRDGERIARQVDDVEKYGKPLAEAFRFAETLTAPPVVREFVKQVEALSALLGESRTEADRERVARRGEVVLELLPKVAASPYLKAERLLVELAADTTDRAVRQRVRRALQRFTRTLAPAQRAMATFNGQRIALANQEMAALRKRLKRAATKQSRLLAELDDAHATLNSQRSLWRRALGRYYSSEDYARTQEQIKELLAAKQLGEVLIDDQDLVRWLDAIVDATLDGQTRRSEPVQGVHASRVLLLSLLEAYCRQQEESALQVARNPFTQVNPKQAMRFMLASEQFILDYFARKQEQQSCLLRSTARTRRERLGHLMDGLIRELKRNLRKL